jgi:molybdopterin molybdotransferase
MISVEEALARILAQVHPLEPEQRPLLDALGQVLAEDVIAGFDIPPLANSAMDGYAVQAASTRGASPDEPRELDVTGEVAAGYVFSARVEAGTAVRIMTGAPLPAGADAVVPFEETDESGEHAPQAEGLRGGRVRIFKAALPENNVRAAGEDVRAGQVVLLRGCVLRAAQLGVLASLGHARVSVIRRPVVAVLSTGDELLAPEQPRAPGRIYDSNATSIAALVRQYGGIPRLLGVARDNVDDLTQKLRAGFDSDLIVTTAGVSRGDFDVVKLVLAQEGEVDFWTVNMRPGKPLAFGAFRAGARRIPHIGLPGNPVSSAVAFEIIAAEPIPMADERRFYARCVVAVEQGRYVAHLAGSQSSGALSALARANALAVIPEQGRGVAAGESVEVLMLNWDAEDPPFAQLDSAARGLDQQQSSL